MARREKTDWTDEEWAFEAPRPRPRVIHTGPGRHECGGVYLCAGCRRYCGWCNGAPDDGPDMCNACWYRAQRLAGRATCLALIRATRIVRALRARYAAGAARS